MKKPTKYQQFGEMLQRLRQARGVATQAELALLLKTTQQSVSRWEAGTSRPRASEVPTIAVVLGGDVAEMRSAAGYASETATVSFDRPLPLPALSPESFERFSLELLKALYPEAKVHLAGKSGHKQFGIDISATNADGTVDTFQCKREADFGAAKVKRAVEAQTFAAEKKVIILSRVASPLARAEIRNHAGWEIWDQEDISRELRSLPPVERTRIIDIFFPGQRFALLGELAPGAWLTIDGFFAPQLAEGRIFNQRWELVGRQEELNDLSRALHDTAIPVVCLIGPAGSGKTRVLRSALADFVKHRPDLVVRIASPTDEITAKSLEDFGSREKLLVVDDVHDRSDIGQLIRHAADPQNKTRLLLVFRPYWAEPTARDLARVGLAEPHVHRVTLAEPSKPDAVNLARQVLATLGGPTDAATEIADLAYDSPLSVVVGAQIVAKEGRHPQLFGTHDVFKATVLKQYETVIAKGIASGRDEDRVRAVLRILALIQPVVPDDRHVLELVYKIEKIDAPDASRLAKLLLDSGALFKRGTKYRLSPDLLADSIIETTCITSAGDSNGYAERVFAVAVPEHKEHILLNFGRLDWRRNEGDTSASRLLDGLWSQLGWEGEYERGQIKAAASAAYYQPRQALQLAERLVAEGHGQDADLCRAIRSAAFTLDYLERACSILWEVGRDDKRPENSHPQHPMRILKELATPEPRKPVQFVENVADFALSLLDDPNSWEGAHTPFDILRGTLATEGDFATRATSREIAFTTYSVRRDSVRKARASVITALLGSLSHRSQRRAYQAASLLSEALRGPMGRAADGDDSWDAEFVETLNTLDALVATGNISAPVLVRIVESIHWHAFFGLDQTRSIALKIMIHLDRDLKTRTIRALLDPWGTNTWPINEEGRQKEFEVAIDHLVRDLAEHFVDPTSLSHFLDDCLQDIARATGASHNTAQLVMDKILRAHLPLARHVVHRLLAGERTMLSPLAGRALAVLLVATPNDARSLISGMLLEGSIYLEALADAYRIASNIAPYTAIDKVALNNVFASHDKRVLWYVPFIVREVAAHDQNLATDLLLKVNVDLALQSNRDFFMWLANDDVVPLAQIRDEHLQHLVSGLRNHQRLDDYWVNAFLKKALKRAPRIVLELAKNRIDDAIEGDDWRKDVLGHALRSQDALGLLSLPNGNALLRDLLDWALERISDYNFSHRFAELIKTLCSPYDDAFVSVIDSWLSSASDSHFTVIAAVLRDAGRAFIFKHDQFVARALSAARTVSRETHKNLRSTLFASAIGGVRSGAPGQPFDADIQLKALAEERLKSLTKADAAYDLYRSLLDHATQDIERQLALGRLMDEEDRNP